MKELILTWLIAEQSLLKLGTLLPNRGMKTERKLQFQSMSVYMKRISKAHVGPNVREFLQALAKACVTEMANGLVTDYEQYTQQEDCPAYLRQMPEKEVLATCYIQTLVACLYQIEYLILLNEERNRQVKQAIGTRCEYEMRVLLKELLDEMLNRFNMSEADALNLASSRLARLVNDLIVSEAENLNP